MIPTWHLHRPTSAWHDAVMRFSPPLFGDACTQVRVLTFEEVADMAIATASSPFAVALWCHDPSWAESMTTAIARIAVRTRHPQFVVLPESIPLEASGLLEYRALYGECGATAVIQSVAEWMAWLPLVHRAWCRVRDASQESLAGIWETLPRLS